MSGSAAVVTQVKVRPDDTGSFENWVGRVTAAAVAAPGFVDVDVVRPTPGFQDDWVLVHRFDDRQAARSWMGSATRDDLMAEALPMLCGDIDVHVLTADESRHSAASAVITTNVEPDREAEFLRWHRRIARAQAEFDGFDGYRLERPIDSVQPSWVAVLRFDSQEHLERWMTSDTRLRLVEEGGFADRTHIRVVRRGFSSWFHPDEVEPAAPVPVWKQNMLVLLVLYPLVFLFGELVQDPLLVEQGVPFWLALFVGNAVSVAALGWVLVPWTSRAFDWWLDPASTRHEWAGVATCVAGYAVALTVYATAF